MLCGKPVETHAQKWRQLVETRRRSFGPERPANFWFFLRGALRK